MLGDVIVGLNGKTVKSEKDLFDILDNCKVGQTVCGARVGGSSSHSCLVLADQTLWGPNTEGLLGAGPCLWLYCSCGPENASRATSSLLTCVLVVTMRIAVHTTSGWGDGAS